MKHFRYVHWGWGRVYGFNIDSEGIVINFGTRSIEWFWRAQ